jgi:excisionase family DNA binding protein
METQTPVLAVGLTEAGKVLNVSRRTIEGYIANKSISARKIGRRTVVTIRELERFLRRDHASPGAKAADGFAGR